MIEEEGEGECVGEYACTCACVVAFVCEGIYVHMCMCLLIHALSMGSYAVSSVSSVHCINSSGKYSLTSTI
jgi:hypothetical protein